MSIKKIYKSPVEFVIMLFLVASLLALITSTYFAFFHQNPPIEFLNLPFPTDKREYTHGEPIARTANFCKFTNASVVIFPRLEGDIVYTLAERKVSGSPKGCAELIFSDIVVPNNVEPGLYKLSGTVEYQVNPIAKREVRWETEEFEVVE